MFNLDDGLIVVLLSCFAAIKVNCQGSCGISNKLNDSSWAVEEQYFNSTLSMADKGSSFGISALLILFHNGKEKKPLLIIPSHERSGTKVAW